MKLIVGLGNPGRKYEKTRHNVGWEVLAELARQGGGNRPQRKFQGECVDATLGGERVLLLAPHTYMNRSGSSVNEARKFYKIEDEDILVVCDDFNLPLAKVRLRSRGSAGGQNGLADVIRCLGHNEVSRLRVGVGEVPASWDPADFVLSKFGKKEQGDIEHGISIACDAAISWATEGAETAMNRFN